MSKSFKRWPWYYPLVGNRISIWPKYNSLNCLIDSLNGVTIDSNNGNNRYDIPSDCRYYKVASNLRKKWIFEVLIFPRQWYLKLYCYFAVRYRRLKPKVCSAWSRLLEKCRRSKFKR